MEKVLKKYTTIPSHLYIKRNADKQLFRIIEEMERPGYVLVARQMGKTNLLFNAKRELENSNNLFAYVDLSNNFSEERDCYRNIIDTVLESNSNIFDAIISDIYTKREKTLLPPHKEYIQELRTILNEFKGKLVIILDEIDALRSVEYSDHIFAQIRSNYFARTNFPEFKNLTYVLSGVIEPTELIKDKNKSPFNIGEKIYLDDFNYDEHKEFIAKSKLKISEEVSKEIYSWTNGNPRLTFDICSEIEEFIIEGGDMKLKEVEAIINNKYLVSFDIAPIDHIRDIVAKNRAIRKAVINIQKDKQNLSDEIRRKLYLYGIIDSNNIKIKNKIIEKSLSLEWLESIERQKQDLYSLGLEKMDNGEYKDAISLFEDYLKNSETPNKELCFFNIGLSHYKLGDLENALKSFITHPFSNEAGKEYYYYEALSLIGICNLGLGNFDEGSKKLEEVIKAKPKSFTYHNALLNLASYYISTNPSRSLELFNELIESGEISNDDENDRKLKTLAHYFKARIFVIQRDVIKSLEEITIAKTYADEADNLELSFVEYLLRFKREPAIIEQIAKTIIERELTFNETERYEISYSEENNNKYLLELYRSNNEWFEKLFHYTLNKHYNNTKNRFEVLFKLSSEAEDATTAKRILYYILENKEELSEELLFKTYKFILLIDSERGKKYESIFVTYKKHFLKTIRKIDSTDISVFAYAIKFYSDKFQLTIALELCKLIESRFIDLSEELEYESLIIYYWYSNIFFTKKESELAIKYADRTLELISKHKGITGSLIDETGIKSIKDQVLQIKISSVNSKPYVRTTKKYGRNDKVKVKYLDNSIKEGKYKHFEADILAERCNIL